MLLYSEFLCIIEFIIKPSFLFAWLSELGYWNLDVTFYSSSSGSFCYFKTISEPSVALKLLMAWNKLDCIDLDLEWNLVVV